MARPRDPNRAARGTGNRAQTGTERTKIMPQKCDPELVEAIITELKVLESIDTVASTVFESAIAELHDRLNDTDLLALKRMAISVQRASEFDAHVEEYGTMLSSDWGWKPNPAAKAARDETKLYLEIADRYALTFIARLRAGILQLAGQSMMENLHSGVAEAIVSQIAALETTRRKKS